MPNHGPTMRTNAILMKVVVASEATPGVLEKIPLLQWFAWHDKSGAFIRLSKEQYFYITAGENEYQFVGGPPVPSNRYLPATVEVTVL